MRKSLRVYGIFGLVVAAGYLLIIGFVSMRLAGMKLGGFLPFSRVVYAFILTGYTVHLLGYRVLGDMTDSLLLRYAPFLLISVIIPTFFHVYLPVTFYSAAARMPWLAKFLIVYEAVSVIVLGIGLVGIREQAGFLAKMLGVFYVFCGIYRLAATGLTSPALYIGYYLLLTVSFVMSSVLLMRSVRIDEPSPGAPPAGGGRSARKVLPNRPS